VWPGRASEGFGALPSGRTSDFIRGHEEKEGAMSHGTRSAKHGAKVKAFALMAVVLAAVLCVFTLIAPARAEEANVVDASATVTQEAQATEPVVTEEPEAAATGTEQETTAPDTQEPAATVAETNESVDESAETTSEPAAEANKAPTKGPKFRASYGQGYDDFEVETEYEPVPLPITPKITVEYVNAPDNEPITGTVQYKFVSGTSTPITTESTATFTVDANGSVSAWPDSQTLKFSKAGTYTFECSQGVNGNYDLASYRDGKNVLYDTAKRYITIKVTGNERSLAYTMTITDKDGNVIATGKNTTPEITIINRGPQYEDAYIPVQVVIQGRDWEAGDSATVSVAPSTGTGSWNNKDTFKSSDLTVDNGSFVVSDDTPNHTSGTYVSSTKHEEGTGYFYITETSAPTGTVLVNYWYARVDWKFDDTNVLRGHVYYGTNTNGGVFAPATAAQLINQIVRVPDPVNVDVTKDLIGREWTDDDSFKFTIEPYTYVPAITMEPSEGDGSSSGGNNPSVVIQLPQSYGKATTVTDTPIQPVAEGASVEVPMTFTGLGKVGYVAPEVTSTTEVAITAASPDKTESFELGFATFKDATYVITEDASAGEEGMTYADPIYVKVHWNDDGSYTLYYSTDPKLSEDSWTTEKPVFENIYEDPNEEEVVIPTPDPEPTLVPSDDPDSDVEVAENPDDSDTSDSVDKNDDGSKGTEDKATEEKPEADTKPAAKKTAAKPAAAKTVVKTSATPKTGDFAMFGEFAAAGAALVGAAAAMARKRK
jgi:hypothetical protein